MNSLNQNNLLRNKQLLQPRKEQRPQCFHILCTAKIKENIFFWALHIIDEDLANEAVNKNLTIQDEKTLKNLLQGEVTQNCSN